MTADAARPHDVRHVWRDRIVLAAAAAISFVVSALADVHHRLDSWVEQYEAYRVDELLTVAAGFVIVYLVVTRWRLRREVTARREREAALTGALHEIEVLSGLLAMCSSCKRIRDEDDRWEPVEVYLQRRGEVSVSHGICPECAHQLYPDYVGA